MLPRFQKFYQVWEETTKTFSIPRVRKKHPNLYGPKSQISVVEHIWLVVDLTLWKMMEFVSWDDDIPNTYGKS
jgi:hypothetical protein